jgi:hypothetical protein
MCTQSDLTDSAILGGELSGEPARRLEGHLGCALQLQNFSRVLRRRYVEGQAFDDFSHLTHLFCIRFRLRAT